jgi:hypothetical protein
MKCKCHNASNEQVIWNVESQDSFDEHPAQSSKLCIWWELNRVYDENKHSKAFERPFLSQTMWTYNKTVFLTTLTDSCLSFHCVTNFLSSNSCFSLVTAVTIINSPSIHFYLKGQHVSCTWPFLNLSIHFIFM